MVASWNSVVVSSLQNAWNIFIGFLPEFIGAIVVLVIGLLIAYFFKIISEKIISALKIDSLLRKLGVEKFVERAGLRLKSDKFIGEIVYWFFVIVVVLAISDILGLWGFSSFLKEVLTYIPNIIAAILILLAAVVSANFLRDFVKASIKSAKLNSSNFLSTLTWWIIVLFGFFAALLQLEIAAYIIQAIVVGVIAMFALAGGIAFGLGGRDYAAYLVEKFKDKTEER